jgi:hypothetical protein
MVEAFNLAIDEVVIAPIEDIKTMMHNKAGKLMKDYISDNKIDEEKMSDEEDKKMRDYISEELRKEFCGISLTKEQFEADISTWIDTI